MSLVTSAIALIAPVAVAADTTVNNPLGNVTICSLLDSLLNAAMILGVPVAVLLIVFAGLKFVTAMGKPGDLEKARSNLFGTLIGLAIFFGASVLIKVVIGTVSQVSGGIIGGICNL